MWPPGGRALPAARTLVIQKIPKGPV
jgi:hypothetical protein